jgi:hypothetical protein
MHENGMESGSGSASSCRKDEKMDGILLVKFENTTVLAPSSAPTLATGPSGGCPSLEYSSRPHYPSLVEQGVSLEVRTARVARRPSDERFGRVETVVLQAAFF